MRKSLFLSIVLISVCFGGYSANPRATRGVANTSGTAGNTQNTTGAVSARVANRGRAAQTKTGATSSATARVATRSAARSAAPMKKAATTTGKATGVTAARAGTKQKAINMGTKVAAAAENTMIPKECTDAFYGCMDSLCMLDAASGGRCRCDDRAEQLDAVLDEIMKLNTRNSVLATEGVRRIQMGDGADTVEKWAEDAANKVIENQKKVEKNSISMDGKSTDTDGKLDFSSLNNSLFDTDSIFDTVSSTFELGSDNFQTADLTNKRGSSLRSAAMKMCGSKVPNQCKEYAKLLTSTYSAQIQSNCLAYINDLKQQKMNAENQYQEAMKAVRDAASTAYKEQNKYTTAGQCAIAFKQCMVGEDVCGEGFENCVINPMLADKTGTINSKRFGMGSRTSKKSINISDLTLEKLNTEKSKCAHVYKQCSSINSDDVWNTFLASVTAEIKSAEIVAEDSARKDCAKNIVKCIKGVAEGEGFRQQGADLWSLFTSQPKYYTEACKFEIAQCNAYDTNTTSGLMAGVENYIEIALNAMRADRCTTRIRSCLTDSCGEDYSGCIGFTMSDLRGFCPWVYIAEDCSGAVDKDGKAYNENNIYDYVNTVAQGLIFNIDKALVTACLKAVDKAMTTYCGDTNSCSSDSNMDFASILKENLNYKIFREVLVDNEKGKQETEKKYITDVSLMTSADATCPRWQTELDIGNIDVNSIYSSETVTNNNQELIIKIDNMLAFISKISSDVVNFKDIKVKGVSLQTEVEEIFGKGLQVTELSKLQLVDGLRNKKLELQGQLNISQTNKETSGSIGDVFASSSASGATKLVTNKLNEAYRHFVELVESDPNVAKCKYGNNYKDFNDVQHGTGSAQADSTAFKNLTNNVRHVVAQSVYDNFMSQYNKRIADLENDMNLANETISKLYTDADMVCALDDSYNAGGGCKIGKCHQCSDLTKRCKCIAKTYFQTTHVRHHNHDDDEYEVTLLASGVIASMAGDTCQFKYRRHKGCKYNPNAKDASPYSGFDCEKSDDDKWVRFTLKKEDKITITSNVAGCTTGMKGDSKNEGWDKALVLNIGNTQICFDKCSESSKVIPYNSSDFHPLEYEGGKYWCMSSGTYDIDMNKSYITDVDNNKDESLYHRRQKFYGNDDW